MQVALWLLALVFLAFFLPLYYRLLKRVNKWGQRVFKWRQPNSISDRQLWARLLKELDQVTGDPMISYQALVLIQNKRPDLSFKQQVAAAIFTIKEADLSNS